MSSGAGSSTTIHRIGGGTVENLRLKPREATLNPPGISVLRAASPGEAARQIRAAIPGAKDLHDASATIGSTSEDLILAAGFDIIPDPSKRLPNHHRIIHPQGAGGFTDENLKKLEAAFTNTTGH